MPESKTSSESLAAIIVANRTLGLFKSQARDAMIELMRRREDEHDDFDFNKFIAEKLNEIPKSQLNPDVIKLMSSLSMLGNIK